MATINLSKFTDREKQILVRLSEYIKDNTEYHIPYQDIETTIKQNKQTLELDDKYINHMYLVCQEFKDHTVKKHNNQDVSSGLGDTMLYGRKGIKRQDVMAIESIAENGIKR
jgi:hypothetical protein